MNLVTSETILFWCLQEGDDNYSQISSDEHLGIDDELPPSVVRFKPFV